jgi:protein-L-isoaspartate(D-aspartate) O-methyltransferase
MSRKPSAPEQIALPLGSAPHPSSAAAQALMAFLLRLRARGVADVSVLRALETVPRELFAPHRFADLALRDIALPIPCGQIMPEPLFVARAMEALAVAPESRVLEIGAGSGYSTAILARLAREVVSVEYFEPLAIESAGRLAQLGIANARVLHGEALAMVGDLGLFDRIVVHAVVEGLPAPLADALAEGGVIVLGRAGGATGARLARIADIPGEGLVETDLHPCRLGAIIGAAPTKAA